MSFSHVHVYQSRTAGQNIRGEKCIRLRVIQSVCNAHVGVLGVSYEKEGL